MTPIYVINLARSADRRAWMTDELGRAGVSANFVAAVDGRAFKDKCRARVAATPLTVGEIALTLSHRKIWRALLASAQTHAIVLEDDVRLGDGFAELPALDWSRWNFDFVKIETMFDPVWATRRGEAVGSRTLHRLGGEHHGSAAYLVSRAGALKALAATRPMNLPIDVAVMGRRVIESGAICAYQLSPAAAVQQYLAPDADPTAALASTLGASRGAKGGELRALKPKGLARAAREARRVVEQASRWLRLSPTMSKRRIPFA